MPVKLPKKSGEGMKVKKNDEFVIDGGKSAIVLVQNRTNSLINIVCCRPGPKPLCGKKSFVR